MTRTMNLRVCGSRAERYKSRGCKKSGVGKNAHTQSSKPAPAKRASIKQQFSISFASQLSTKIFLISQFMDSDIIKIENLIADYTDYADFGIC